MFAKERCIHKLQRRLYKLELPSACFFRLYVRKVRNLQVTVVRCKIDRAYSLSARNDKTIYLYKLAYVIALLVFAFDNTFEFVIIIFLAGFHAEVGDTES